MKQIKNKDDIKMLGTILCVWAHPDDESFSCAGIMAAAIENGQEVICITATKGEAGVQDAKRWPPDKLADIRSHEMHQAMQIIGCHHHHWLGYLDGHCQEVPLEQGAAKVREFVQLNKPDTILTFGPDGMTGHPDHQTVSHWVDEAIKDTETKVYHAVEERDRYEKYMVEADKKFDIYFNIDKPPVLDKAQCDIAFDLPPDILTKKRSALEVQHSQTERMFNNLAPDMMNAMISLETFVLSKPAEK